MLNMTEAFSNANEYCEVGLCVKASNLWSGQQRVEVIVGSVHTK